MIQTFIVCHDPRVIDHYEKTGHYTMLKNYKYILVGQKEYSGSDKVIIARDLPINIEDKKHLLVFTAWYAIVHNNLVTEKWVRLLEYDTILTQDIEHVTVNNVHYRAPFIGVWGHFPYHITNQHFVNTPDWIETLDVAMRKVYNVGIHELVDKSKKDLPYWMGTSNILFSKDELINFVNWYTPLADIVYTDPRAGHGLERALTFYCYHQNKPFHFIQNVVQHFQLNSHGTQQAGDYEDNLKKIIK